jgi:CRP-like cAMP-binding protein
MTEYEKLIAHFEKYVSLSKDEKERLISSFNLIKVKKRQFIVQPNFVAKHRYFVLKGAFRTYVVSNEGEEHTIQFAIEDWWISDYNSYIFQQPATMFVVALENSTVLQIDYTSEQKLKSSNHTFETIFRMMAERSTAFMQRRIITNLTKSAEERYNEFIEKYPSITNRVPQYTLASYLGFTTEFLSRLRSRLRK